MYVSRIRRRYSTPCLVNTEYHSQELALKITCFTICGGELLKYKKYFDSNRFINQPQ